MLDSYVGIYDLKELNKKFFYKNLKIEYYDSKSFKLIKVKLFLVRSFLKYIHQF